MKTIPNNAAKFLDYLNEEYFKLHKKYEDFYWISYMGDHSIDDKFNLANNNLTNFLSDPELLSQTQKMMKSTSSDSRLRLKTWERFFKAWQTPSEVIPLKKKIVNLESLNHEKKSKRKEGYIDPKSNKFIKASETKMEFIMATSPDEKLRKACFDALEKLAVGQVPDYVTYADALNQYGKALGFEDFYAYKIFVEEGMTKKELFSIFDELFEKTKYAFKNVKKLKAKNPGILKPWNFSFMLSGDFAKEEDQYYSFENALELWGRSFGRLGVDFRKSELVLDLLDRPGKYSNGFCCWPEIIRYKGNKRLPGKANFTCNVSLGDIGSAENGMHTLFHEGGHAAHYLNSNQKDVSVNHEYPPSSTAWAETQSMFMDTIFESIEWRRRYAKNKNGESYPLDLFQRKIDKLHILSPLSMMGMMRVMYFEKAVYESKKIDEKRIVEINNMINKKFSFLEGTSHRLLRVPHIYAWDSACSYHGYALAELAVYQWREHFYNKYGFIVDNPNIGKDMLKVWTLGMSKRFPEFVKLATGKKLSPLPFVRSVTRSKQEIMSIAKKRIEITEKKSRVSKDVDLNAKITLVHGKEKIANNSKGFEFMTRKYALWLAKQ